MHQWSKVCISHFSAWAPGLENTEAWQDWATGSRQLISSDAGPSLEFTEPLFRRRLSQLSRMTIHVLHDVLSYAPNSKIVFSSFRGEIERQLKINKALIEQFIVMPASFSLSVFNTPVALATIALNHSAGYTSVYPAHHSLFAALTMAAAPIMAGDKKNIVFIYADEKIPEEYEPLSAPTEYPLALSLVLTPVQEASDTTESVKTVNCSELFASFNNDYSSFLTPESILKTLYSRRET